MSNDCQDDVDDPCRCCCCTGECREQAPDSLEERLSTGCVEGEPEVPQALLAQQIVPCACSLDDGWSSLEDCRPPCENYAMMQEIDAQHAREGVRLRW